MKKLKRSFKVNYTLNWSYGIEISKIREDLDAIEKLGATHVEIEASVQYDSATLEIEAISDRFETDEEYNVRIEEMKRRKSSLKQQELNELNRLKSKYGM